MKLLDVGKSPSKGKTIEGLVKIILNATGFKTG